MATGKTTTDGEIENAQRAAVDNGTATESAAPEGTPDPRAPKPMAPADGAASRITLLAASRQNGTFDGGEHDLGEGESHKASIELNVLNLFGGPDANVELSGRVMTREDTTQDWREAAAFESIRSAGRQTASATLRRLVTFTGVVSGTTGGHAVELEVVAEIR